MKTILHLTPFDQSISGSDESLLDLIASLKADGWNCVVAMPKTSPYAGRYIDAGAATAFMPVACVRRSYSPLYWAGFARDLAIGLTSMSSVITSSGADIIHVNMETAVAGPLVAKLRKVPCVVHVRSTSISRPRPVFEALVKFLASCSDRAVAISNAVRNLMIDGGFPEDRISTIYDPIDTNKFRPASLERKKALHEKILAPLDIPEGAPVFGLIGRMNPIKGQDVFVKAAAMLAKEHKDARFVLVGDAADERERSYEAGIKRLAEDLGIADRSRFLGYRADVCDIMPLLAASVSPSTTEAFGRPAAEAMACGTCAIVSNVDGLKEIVVDGETGFIVPMANPDALYRAMMDILADDSRCERMGVEGRKRVVENFGAGVHASKMKSLFESLT